VEERRWAGTVLYDGDGKDEANQIYLEEGAAAVRGSSLGVSSAREYCSEVARGKDRGGRQR
jgi:hypothetical protein